MLVKQKGNLEQDLIIIKGPIKKKRKVPKQRFQENYGQHSHNGIDNW